MMTTITINIIREILRKYLRSFFDKGFVGVSSGEKTAMLIEDIIESINITVCKSYELESFINTMQAAKEKVDRSSHLVSVFA